MLSHFMFWLGLSAKRIKNVNITYKMNAVWARAPENKGFSERTVTRLIGLAIMLCQNLINVLKLVIFF